jgi:hypothetical protein
MSQACSYWSDSESLVHHCQRAYRTLAIIRQLLQWLQNGLRTHVQLVKRLFGMYSIVVVRPASKRENAERFLFGLARPCVLCELGEQLCDVMQSDSNCRMGVSQFGSECHKSTFISEFS